MEISSDSQNIITYALDDFALDDIYFQKGIHEAKQILYQRRKVDELIENSKYSSDQILKIIEDKEKEQSQALIKQEI